MTGQYISLTPAQAKAFRAMVEQAMKKGDEAIVALAEEHEDILTQPYFEDVRQAAEEAFDRLDQARAEAEVDMEFAQQKSAKIEKTAREFSIEDSRKNTARELHNWGPRHQASAESMDISLEEVDGGTAAWVAKTLSGLINSRVLKPESWMLKAVCLQQNQALAMARHEEGEAMSFIAPLISVFSALSAERVSERDLRYLESILERRVRPSEKWAVWAKKALERCIRFSHQDLFEVLVELADEVKEGLAENRGATTLIDGLLRRVNGAIEQHRHKNARERAGREHARRARQLARTKKNEQ